MSALNDVKQHPFYRGVPWDSLRDSPAPFVPALESELDAGYFDDFSNPEDAAKYAEVFEKQKNVNAIAEKDEPFNRGVWVGFTYKPRGKAIDEIGVRIAGLHARLQLTSVAHRSSIRPRSSLMTRRR